jgi:hypothetical protein
LANENHPYEEQLQLNDSALDQSVAKVSERTSGTVSQPSAVPKSASGSGGRTGKSSRQEFFLPVSGFVWLLPEEVAVVDHPAVQRLGRIYQLGQSYVVFRGATHKRLEHVIGALHVVQRMIAAVKTNSEKFVGDPNWGPPLSDSEARFVQLGTLLHDIGHMAAGHTVEDELQLVSKHDADTGTMMTGHCDSIGCCLPKFGIDAPMWLPGGLCFCCSEVFLLIFLRCFAEVDIHFLQNFAQFRG